MRKKQNKDSFIQHLSFWHFGTDAVARLRLQGAAPYAKTPIQHERQTEKSLYESSAVS